LRELGDVTGFRRNAPAEVTAPARGASILLSKTTPLTAAHLAVLEDLRYVGILATGYNVVDVIAARAREIVVTNVPVYGTQSVAQHVFALLLELTQRVGQHSQAVREGRWRQSSDWCFWDGGLVELAGLTLGVIGMGRIGNAVAQLGEAVGPAAIQEVLDKNLGPQVRDPSVLSPNLWSYIDAYDLADAIRLAAESDLPGHEVFYIASPDNSCGRDFAELLRTYYGEQIELRLPLARPDASGISSEKAKRLLGWKPTRSWRDYLDENGRSITR